MKGSYTLRNAQRQTQRYKWFRVTVTLCGIVLISSFNRAAAEGEPEAVNVEYNPDFIHGSGVDVARFSAGNPVLPGKYDVIVWVNGEKRGKENILFRVPEGQSGAEACLSFDQLTRLGIRLDEKKQDTDKSQQCAFMHEWIDQSSSRYNSGDFELNIRVPQLNLVAIPRGYIDPSLWESGETAGFVDYSGNIYSQFQGPRDGAGRANSYNSNLQLAAGFNYGEWRLRKRITTNWASGNSPTTQNLYGYAARDITSLKSELVMGDTNTAGDLFDSFSLRGVMLRSDERMLPDSLRSYTPVLRGIAETNARVTVMQRGLNIYETVVPPGPFELSDIGTMGWGGDLELVVTEADGRQRRQSVPFSAPPMLLHEGVSNFTLLAGELKDQQSSLTPPVAQGTYRYGLSNAWTLYGGAQFGEKYHAFGIGNAFNTPIGGISFDLMHAKSIIRNDEHASGNSYQINYSKYLSDTDTNLTLAAYRYSTRGFYSFREAATERDARYDLNANRDTRTRHRFTATVSQRVADTMSLWFSGSLYTYWGDRGDSRQYSVTFNHSLNTFSYGLTAMRSRNELGHDENSVLLSVSVPLGSRTAFEKPLFSSVYSSVSKSNTGNTQFQMQANGSQGVQNELTYGVGSSAGNFSQGQRDRAVNGNVNYRAGYGQIGATASANNHNAQQLSLSVAGSVIAHAGGITAGPTIGEQPFAIVSAEGASGARLLNGYGSKIDAFGYAIMPSLTPYRENAVQLDSRGLPETVDVLENERVVVPRQGAAIAVNMKTITGAPMVLTLRNEKGEVLPIGSDIQDEKGASLAVVGQGGQAFVRGLDIARQGLFVNLGDNTLRCESRGNAAVPEDTKHITQLEVVCLPKSN